METSHPTTAVDPEQHHGTHVTPTNCLHKDLLKGSGTCSEATSPTVTNVPVCARGDGLAPRHESKTPPSIAPTSIHTCTTESYAKTSGSQGSVAAITKSPEGGLIALCCLSLSPSTEAKPSRSKKRWSAGDAGVHGVVDEVVAAVPAPSHTSVKTTSRVNTTTQPLATRWSMALHGEKGRLRRSDEGEIVADYCGRGESRCRGESVQTSVRATLTD